MRLPSSRWRTAARGATPSHGARWTGRLRRVGGAGSGTPIDSRPEPSRARRRQPSAGAMPAQPVRAAPPRVLPEELIGSVARPAHESARARCSQACGGQRRAREGPRRPRSDRLVFGRLLAGRPLDRKKLRYRARRRPAHELLILAVDCSSSMLHQAVSRWRKVSRSRSSGMRGSRRRPSSR